MMLIITRDNDHQINIFGISNEDEDDSIGDDNHYDDIQKFIIQIIFFIPDFENKYL